MGQSIVIALWLLCHCEVCSARVPVTARLRSYSTELRALHTVLQRATVRKFVLPSLRQFSLIYHHLFIFFFNLPLIYGCRQPVPDQDTSRVWQHLLRPFLCNTKSGKCGRLLPSFGGGGILVRRLCVLDSAKWECLRGLAVAVQPRGSPAARVPCDCLPWVPSVAEGINAFAVPE